MIVEHTIVFEAPRRVRLAWTGTPDLLAWLFVNGELVQGPLEFDGTAREAELIDVPDPALIEVHECAAGEAPAANSPVLARRPWLWWTAIAAAYRYIVYWKADAEAAEETLARLPVSGTLYQEVRAPDLRAAGGVWNWFRVEARNERGETSEREAWPFFVEGLPAAPVSCVVTGGEGVFDLEFSI